MTNSQREQKEIAVIVGEIIGTIVGSLITSAIIAGLFYVILHFMIGLNVTYLQTLGVFLIVNFLKNLLTK